MDTFNPREYWESRLSRSSGLQGVGYLGLGQPFNAWMYKVRRIVFKRIVGRNITKFQNLDVLDMGSGTGFYLEIWRGFSVQSVTGTDLTAAATNDLRQRFPDLEIKQLDISDPKIDLSKTYDVISCMDVLFHIVNDESLEQAFCNFRRLLKPDGYLVISENFLHGKALGSAHFNSRYLEHYQEILKRNGFIELDRRPMFHLMNTPADSTSPFLHRWWNGVTRICKASARMGGVLATLVFPFESALVRLRREGVSTEIMVCQANGTTDSKHM